MRRIFGPKKNEVTGVWRKLHNEDLHDLYSSPTIVRVIKSRKMRWAEHIPRLGEGRVVYMVLVGSPEGKRPLGDPGVDGMIVLRWIFNKLDLGIWTD
jgi:hypothetical protein